MAQNGYTHTQPGMAAQYDPRSQPYPHQAYPRQQSHPPQQQVYGQAQPAAAYLYTPSSYAGSNRSGAASPVTRSPLPPQPPPSYGHPPQQPYTSYSPQGSYTPPPSFEQRGVLQTSSPVSGRRPLPEPGHAVRSNSVSHRSVPQATPPPGPRAPAHRPTLSVSSVPTPPARPVTPTSSQAPPKTTTAASPPRPLPQPALPRSVGHSNFARSPSPTKSTFADAQSSTPRPSSQSAGPISTPTPTRPIPGSVLPPAAPPAQKFIPHWKRALPTPGQQSPQIERRSTVSGSGTTPPSSVRPLPQSPSTYARGQSGQSFPRPSANQTNSPPRKLPQPNGRPPLARSPSPTRSSRPGSIGSSDDDDISENALLSRPQDWHSSPQYGVRDLPVQNRTSKDSVFAVRPLNEQHPRPPSHHEHSQSVPVVSTQRPQASPIARRWPPGLPQLPRAPAALESLDDAPPPSLRRSPSPIRPAPTSPLRGARRPSIRTNALPSPRQATSPGGQRTPYDSPTDATPPPSGTSDSSVFTLSSFPRPPSSAQPRQTVASPAPVAAKSPPARRPSHRSVDSVSSVFALSAFPQPPPPVVVELPPRKDSLGRTQNNQTPVPLAREAPSQGTGRMRQQVSFPANADSDSDGENAVFSVPAISINVSGADDDDMGGPVINISGADDDAPGLPSIFIGGADDDSVVPLINMGGPSEPRKKNMNPRSPLERAIRKGPGLTCGGCGGAIVGRTVYAMGAKWHPGCFRCCVCDELLENLSSYEHEGKAYCNLDYHEVCASLDWLSDRVPDTFRSCLRRSAITARRRSSTSGSSHWTIRSLASARIISNTSSARNAEIRSWILRVAGQQGVSIFMSPRC